MKRNALNFLIVGLIFSLTGNVIASECGGKGYTGVNNRYCLQCHEGCSSLHPVMEVKVRETKCLKIPDKFPLNNGYLVCTTCHDMTLSRKFFLRGSIPFKNRFDFCFECHNPECYKKFNPHKTMASSDLPKKQKLKVCIYCHGVGARLEAYKACVGCHTRAPHVGALEHLLATREKVKKLVGNKKTIVDISSMKDLKPKLDEEVLKNRRPKILLVKGRIECVTCHNPHPQIAVIAPSIDKDWLQMEREDVIYKIKKLYKRLKNFEVNAKRVELMSGNLKNGELCQVCHSINSLK